MIKIGCRVPRLIKVGKCYFSITEILFLKAVLPSLFMCI